MFSNLGSWLLNQGQACVATNLMTLFQQETLPRLSPYAAYLNPGL